MPALTPQPETPTLAEAILAKGIRRLKFLQRQIDGHNAEKAAVYGELKAQGFTTKIVRRQLTLMKVDPIKQREEDDLLALYQRAWERFADVVESDEFAPADQEVAA